MLASTVQFSRNGPRQPPPPHTGGNREPARRRNPPTQGAGSLRTQQRARPRPHPPRPVPGRHSRPVLAGGKTRAEANSQRSTRRHGRPGQTSAALKAPGAP